MQQIQCSVCETEIAGNFCPECGQKIGVQESTLKSVATEFFALIFSLNKSVFAAILKILKTPKVIVVNYWKGNRGFYISPMRMLFYSMILIALTIGYTDNTILGLSFEITGLKAQFGFWGLFFPLLTISSYLCFRHRQSKFVKHVVAIAYIGSCFMIVCTIVLVFGIHLAPDLMGSLFLVFALLVFIWNARIFTYRKGFLWIGINTLIQLIVFSCLIACLLLMIELLSPGTITSF